MNNRSFLLFASYLTLASLFIATCQAPAETPTATLQSATQTPGPQTATPTQVAQLPTVTVEPETNHHIYNTYSGDSLSALALRFGVDPDDIRLADGAQLPEEMRQGFLDFGTTLHIPKTSDDYLSAVPVLPDSEVILSGRLSGSSSQDYLENQEGGFLGKFSDNVFSGMPQPAGAVIDRVALENSVNPLLLMTLLEMQCGCVTGPLGEDTDRDYLMGVEDYRRRGIYRQLIWTTEQLFSGYYGWRDGSVTMVTFPDGQVKRLNPFLNAGTVAVKYTLAQLYPYEEWETALRRLESTHFQLFGNWPLRAAGAEPIFEPGLAQPELTLPFLPGHTWAFTGGPHSAWEKSGANAALDFTPASLEASCETSYEWIVASAAGLIVRAERGVVVQDLDGDGIEQTGWVLLYVHVADAEHAVEVGEWLQAGELLGHPSCEGGPSSSTHLHIARKYNGEWMLAGGPIPFILDGWVAAAGNTTYQGTLSKDGDTIAACQCGTADTYVTRPSDEDQ